ncbi:isoaspartyl peptidase/L-asparaginase family protein [Fulvivirga sediminis]|uniref:Isoaspartyl peptidase n=1 Tax=Fulvivirga sediminis TaxID=2803949 RepID=A0A937JYY3_9BACT|nr:isoaspartyl peptidase/L-asparaginase [Fulvivirga sediminis]MBL3654611.1 isoaspartyl peptidase/L-asparaginase [Fulvivirga sediminis]
MNSCTYQDQKNDLSADNTKSSEEVHDAVPITLVIHGGAGNIKKENMTPEHEEAYRAKLEEALMTGYTLLKEGKSAMDAVTATIQVMEKSPLFNAGVGAVFTNQGKNELDASVMDGSTGMAGAVAGVSIIKSPILAARAVMEQSPHVMMSGQGAELFAKEAGLEIVDPSYFFDQRRFEQFEKIKEQQEKKETAYMQTYPDYKFGTVGCVALDAEGNIAAGTSTGGMTNKKYGRIGDSPIIGAGTYADNATCGVSSTGHGEFFIRNVIAYDIAANMKYRNISLEQATREVITRKLTLKGGTGGVIALDKKGNVSITFNTAGMFRGYIKDGSEPEIFMYGN